MRLTAIAVVALVWTNASSRTAQADEVNAGIGDELPNVGDRHGGRGLHFSRFWVLPTLETGAFYDSNPLTVSGGDSSFGAYVAPNIAAKSDFSRHALNFRVGAHHSEYSDDVEARTNLFGEADSRIDIHRDLVLTSGVRGGLFEDSQGVLSAPLGAVEPVSDLITPLGAAEPVTYSTLDLWSKIHKVFNQLAVSADVGYHAADYDDVPMVGGGTLDQDFRNGHGYEAGGRAAYLFSPGYSLFVGAHYNERIYDTGENDSTGWRALSGVEFEITRLLRGEVGAGYMMQDFESGAEASDFSYHAALIWNPTMLMTVRVDGDRIVGESSLAGSPGTIATSLRAGVDYEVLRSLIIAPFVGVAFEDFISSSVDAQSVYAGIRANYLVNRFLSVGFDYRFEDVRYSGADGDYDRHIVGVNAAANF